MTSTSAALTPVLFALALTLQGCIFSPYKAPVLVSIGQQCDKKADSFSDAVGLKDILGGQQGCESLDDELLNKFSVTDCSTVLHELVLFTIGAECELTTSASVTESCPQTEEEEEDRDAKVCLAAVTSAVDEFEPSDISKDDPLGADGFEEILGLVQECNKAVMEKTSEESFLGMMSKVCDPDGLVVDSDFMEGMEVTPEDCEKYFGDQHVEVGTIACVSVCVYRDDAPGSPDDATYAWMQKAVKEAVEPWFEEGGFPLSKMVDSLPKLADARLRLFAAIRQGNWAELRRRPRTTTAIAISASSALAFVALLGVARRLRAAGRSSPDGAEPILEEEAQLAA